MLPCELRVAADFVSPEQIDAVLELTALFRTAGRFDAVPPPARSRARH